jgi:hypothetical protein
MAKFVSQFDQISSYIDDISDKDLIHMFLEAVSPEYKVTLRNNPAVGGPWEVYAHLRKYALHMFPDEGPKPSTNPPSQFDPKKRKFNAAAETARALAESLYGGGPSKRAKSGAGQQNGGGSSGSGGGNGGAWKEFTNAVGMTVRRTAAQHNKCFDLRLCGFCYRSGHSNSACKASRPAEGDPPGPSSK